MTNIPLPADLTQRIAIRALRYTRQYSQSRNWSRESTQSFVPVFRDGYVNITTSRRHLLYQDQGTRPHVMWGLEGKTIPMGGGQFRVAKGVGRPGYVTLPSNYDVSKLRGNVYPVQFAGGVRVWRNQKWRHPGLQPQHYIRDAINRAIQEMTPMLKRVMAYRMRNGGRPNTEIEIAMTWRSPQ